MNSLEKNIVTIEDPVEYQLDIINQNQVKEQIGLTFAKMLKHVLRQDPDIIMVGEIREYQTAEIAVQAALTGHLVLSTLHTNDAISAVTRLLGYEHRAVPAFFRAAGSYRSTTGADRVPGMQDYLCADKRDCPNAWQR